MKNCHFSDFHENSQNCVFENFKKYSVFYKGKKNHPFTVGKIVFQNNKFIKIIVIDGFLKIKLKDIKIKNFKKINYLGKTFFNYFDDLRNSYLSRTDIFKYY